MSHVLVIGSSNTDLVVQTPRLPAPGETLLGGTFFSAAGGKGANQAVAAARAGAQVTFIACIGQDDFGNQALANFAHEGINTQWVTADADRASGVAFILVDENGENSIVVASGANAALSPAHIKAATDAFTHASLCLLQLETPIETVFFAATLASDKNVPVVLNPAPATVLPDDLWPHLFLITPNENETERLTGILPVDLQSAEKAGHKLLEKGAQNAIVTLGAKGACLITPTKTHPIPAFDVTPVDTTAAGDAFNGALACALGENQPLEIAARFACAAGALTVTKSGAQPAIPSRSDINQLYKY